MLYNTRFKQYWVTGCLWVCMSFGLSVWVYAESDANHMAARTQSILERVDRYVGSDIDRAQSTLELLLDYHDRLSNINNTSTKVYMIELLLGHLDDRIKQLNQLSHVHRIDTNTSDSVIDVDIISDDSITKFVSPLIWFCDRSYIPDALVYVEHRWVWIDSRMKEFFLSLATQYEHDTWRAFVVTSSWRSFEHQMSLSSLPICMHAWRCAPAWHSEHQTWLAIDVSWLGEEWYVWMKQNAHTYWFHQSYQFWIESDGYIVEPRHWRFLWVPLATYLYDQQLSFTRRANPQSPSCNKKP